MSKIIWDLTGERHYETGINCGVLYPMVNGQYSKGVAWNGLTSVSEKPSGAESTPVYADNIKYLNLISAEDFAATIEALESPVEFDYCDGSAEVAPGITIGQQTRQKFGMAYKTIIGSDTEGEDYGYKIHIIYNATASPSEKSYTTVNDSPEAMSLSWEITTTTMNVTGYKPTARLTIDSTKTPEDAMKKIIDALYGVDAPDFDDTKTYKKGDFVNHGGKTYECKNAITTPAAWSSTDWEITDKCDPYLPTPDEIIELCK